MPSDFLDSSDSDALRTNGRTHVVALNSGTIDDYSLDAGLVLPAGVDPASLGDYVWYDLNADGIQDSGEPAAEGVLVRLLDENGFLIEEASTDGNGLFLFDNIVPGNYRVSFVEPGSDITFSLKAQGSDTEKDSDVASLGLTVFDCACIWRKSWISFCRIFRL